MVRISTMDWLGQSQYASQTVFWPSLSSDRDGNILQERNSEAACSLLDTLHPKHRKILEEPPVLKHPLRVFEIQPLRRQGRGQVLHYYLVPGYNETGPALAHGAPTGNRYPDFTRVNHGKYAVSDVRANIGTSNLIWDYFYTTAGVSFAMYDPSIVSQLQDVFGADWDSPYTMPVKPLEASRFFFVPPLSPGFFS
ncbi:unnamed protein product [Triticum turgidum subsp. durum]|uniref:Phospholipase D n=1 Tax=Triticum turgidum subsp. durum TaxID=4567 RepID=A0A9R1AB78_TRITD|nr:unnamed protein product [Triticum turgidum subsp. durum]